MYKLIRNIGFAVVSLGLGMASCDEDYPKSHIEPYDTELLSIKILNAGANGDKVVEGTIDEAKKTINFPRLDVETDFSALSIEAELSEGAALQSEVMDYSMDAETNEKTQVLRIINHNRYKDYLMKVRKEFRYLVLILKSRRCIIFREIIFIVILLMQALPDVLRLTVNMC